MNEKHTTVRQECEEQTAKQHQQAVQDLYYL